MFNVFSKYKKVPVTTMNVLKVRESPCYYNECSKSMRSPCYYNEYSKSMRKSLLLQWMF